MIVVVEGPSAAGKTTWCQAHAAALVEERIPAGDQPGRDDLASQARYWTAANSARWLRAVALEGANPLVCCDTDPLKLHYSWCLARIGAGPWERFTHGLTATRQAFVDGRLGFADLVLVSIPPLAVLRERRDNDPARRRHRFDLHAQLSDSLHEWYCAVDALEPGRVIWELPNDGLPAKFPAPRQDRTNPKLLDELVGLLDSA